MHSRQKKRAPAHGGLRLVCAFALGVSLLPAVAANPAPNPDDGETQAPPALTVPRTEAAPIIDGDISDAVWRKAALIPRLSPARDATSKADLAIQPTTVRALWDERNLYVAFECTDDEVFSTGTLKHDDDIYTEDVCEVFVDGKGDGRQYVEIQVGPTGVNLDLMHLLTAEAEQGPDLRLSSRVMKKDRWAFREWEMPGLQTAAKTTAFGWSAELAIPAGPIMKRRGATTFMPAELRAHFMRYDWIKEEGRDERRLIQQNWSPVPHGNPHNSPGLMGRLLLTNDVPSSLNLD
ncbi:MAG: carbohydrate-binding family 9-like protein [Kiritimatiellia bacterium]